MTLDEVESKIEARVVTGASHPLLAGSVETDGAVDYLFVIKYTSPKWLADTLSKQTLFASKTPGFTWGDAVYVAPIAYPRTTMMYGAVGIVGWMEATQMRFFDAADPAGLDLYQEWIRHFAAPYRQLTTTVHANSANQELRNKFRQAFRIDVVLFRPDEVCAGYVDPTNDVWLAVTNWNLAREVAPGATGVVRDLKWCALSTEAFEPEGMGYKPLLLPQVGAPPTFVRGAYRNLRQDIRSAYRSSGQTIVITEF